MPIARHAAEQATPLHQARFLAALELCWASAHHMAILARSGVSLALKAHQPRPVE